MNKEKKQVVTQDNLKEIAVMTIAVGIIAAAVYFFLIPSQTSISSVSALAIIIAHYVPLHVSTVTMILNVVLLLIGFITGGKEFGAKTVYTSILLPLYLAVFEQVFPDFDKLAYPDWESLFRAVNYRTDKRFTLCLDEYPYLVEQFCDEDRVIAQLDYARMNADAVIVFAHWGTEYSEEVDEDQQYWSDLLIEHGVDVVVGTHPHVLQPYEMRTREDGHQMLVYYSLGNLISGQDREECLVGGLAEFTLVKSPKGEVSVEEYGLEKVVTQQGEDGCTVYLLNDHAKVPMKNAILAANFLGKTQINLIGRFLRFVTDFSLHIKLAYSRL